MSPQSERATHMGVILTPRFAFFCETTACYASGHVVPFLQISQVPTITELQNSALQL